MCLVASVDDFKKKYGTIGAKVIVESFIMRSPDFSGKQEFAVILAEIMADLERVLISLNTKEE